MIDIEKINKDHGIDDFSRMTVFASEFVRLEIENRSVAEKNKVENFEYFVGAWRIANRIKQNLARTVPIIKNDPIFQYLDGIVENFVENGGETGFSDKFLMDYIDRIFNFSFEYR